MATRRAMIRGLDMSKSELYTTFEALDALRAAKQKELTDMKKPTPTRPPGKVSINEANWIMLNNDISRANALLLRLQNQVLDQQNLQFDGVVECMLCGSPIVKDAPFGADLTFYYVVDCPDGCETLHSLHRRCREASDKHAEQLQNEMQLTVAR